MDRCRCADYEEAVRKLRINTPGTLRPDVIEKCDRSGFKVSWIRHGVSHDDMNFVKPKVMKLLQPHELPENKLSKDARKIEQMWCPFMTPFKVVNNEL